VITDQDLDHYIQKMDPEDVSYESYAANEEMNDYYSMYDSSNDEESNSSANYSSS